ncbi:MAG: hypothetical protein ACTS2F_20420 [Thainema sp.]
MFRGFRRRWRWVMLGAIAGLAILLSALISHPSPAQPSSPNPTSVDQPTINQPTIDQPAHNSSSFLLAHGVDIRDPICDVYPNTPYKVASSRRHIGERYNN